jgi:hypothetical protein
MTYAYPAWEFEAEIYLLKLQRLQIVSILISWKKLRISPVWRVYQCGSRALHGRDSLKEFHFEELLLRSSERSEWSGGSWVRPTSRQDKARLTDSAEHLDFICALRLFRKYPEKDQFFWACIDAQTKFAADASM